MSDPNSKRTSVFWIAFLLVTAVIVSLPLGIPNALNTFIRNYGLGGIIMVTIVIIGGIIVAGLFGSASSPSVLDEKSNETSQISNYPDLDKIRFEDDLEAAALSGLRSIEIGEIMDETVPLPESEYIPITESEPEVGSDLEPEPEEPDTNDDKESSDDSALHLNEP